jgi:hypothetical protein
MSLERSEHFLVRFTGKNYSAWAFQFQIFVKGKEILTKKSELIFCKIFLALVGISQSARGYCMISVLETMKTYSLEDGLTEEALVTKLRTCQYHHLFLHSSLRHNSSGLHFLTFEAFTTFLK